MDGARSTAIQAVVFDLGNVLVRFSHERMIKQLSDLAGLPAETIRRWAFDQQAYWHLETGTWSDDDFAAEFRRLAGRDIPLADIEQAGADIFDEMPGIMPILAHLRQRGTRLVLLSNTCRAHFDFVRHHYDVAGYFDELILSYVVRARKPEPAIYQATLAVLGCPAHAALYFDDILENVTAGAAAGLRAELYTTPQACAAVLQEHGLMGREG